MMNDKLKELAMKAGFCEEYRRGIISPFMGDSDISELLEDFAQLIIKECIDNIETYPIGIVDSAKMEDVITHIVYTLNAVRDEIKDNFGIKYER
jgi:hypothetical protein